MMTKNLNETTVQVQETETRGPKLPEGGKTPAGNPKAETKPGKATILLSEEARESAAYEITVTEDRKGLHKAAKAVKKERPELLAGYMHAATNIAFAVDKSRNIVVRWVEYIWHSRVGAVVFTLFGGVVAYQTGKSVVRDAKAWKANRNAENLG